MSEFDLQVLPFDLTAISHWAELDPRYRNWPVVYTLQGQQKVYVGETLNASTRLRQHLDSHDKRELEAIRVVIDESFNKSVCLDLESYLIRLFSGDGAYEVLNRNVGITNAEYYRRSEYQVRFDEIFESLRAHGLFTRSISEIENSALFKLSPFKALTDDQAVAVEEILRNLFGDIATESPKLSVVEGNPGTGKTVVGIYLVKLLRDVATHDFVEPVSEDTFFSEFFSPDYVSMARSLNVGLVVPQQSLRQSIQRVFENTTGLHKHQVLSPFDVGQSDQHYDLLVVDEAHRLSQRANQPAAALNRKFSEINMRLFGNDDFAHTQLDWIIAQSKHQVLLLDPLQTVRPADLPLETTRAVSETSKDQQRWYPLTSQMRIRANEDYVGYVRRVLNNAQTDRMEFADYDLKFFDNLADMYETLAVKEAELGLCRLVAGYAWPWVSRNDPHAFDIAIDGLSFKWNTTTKDWVTSANAFDEVGSIHTVQGYDLNYAGVIIGRDLYLDQQTRTVSVDRSNYFDSKGKENNPRLGLTYSDDELLAYVKNIYAVLLTRGIMGTYIYVSDEHLRNCLSRFF